MSVIFGSILCCCLTLLHAFLFDQKNLPDCTPDEVRQHCHDRAVKCTRLDYTHPIYYCIECQPGFHGNRCGQGSSLTSMLPPTAATQAVQTTRTPLTQTSTTKTAPEVHQYCNRYSVVADLSHGQPVSNGFAPHCPSGSYASTEAFVLNNCNVSTPDMWHQGKQIALQVDCDQTPEVRTVVQGGLGFLDPNYYYTIA
ncbi:uncharacterized protein LOC128240158 isoform X2 [Mya arenaria]|uniref:uncharacterized protein LOC128240158 isoform X2 n=1 Tax=Mya arenaria TaxID=6604 RepID=UPI0022DF0673|nr:uncharacterized protein LOC128240158 isoform X2 [Mya arenaria]